MYLISILFLVVLISANNSQICKKTSEKLVCNKIEIKNDSFNYKDSDEIYIVYFKLQQPEILNEDFIQSIILWKNLDRNFQIFWFKNLLGFDINLFRTIGTKYSDIFYSYNIYDSKIRFYNGSQPLDECYETYPREKFKIKFTYFYFMLKNVFTSKLCLYHFNQFQIYQLYLQYLSNTFYKKNVLTFRKVDQQLDIQIVFGNFQYCYNIDLTDDLINSQLFKATTNLFFYGKVKSIQSTLFTNLTSLKSIVFDIYYARQLFQNTKTDWLENLNIGIGQEQFTSQIIHVTINQKINQEYYFLFDINHVFPDEDFCLYKNFPFKRLILLSIFDNAPPKYDQKYSCTFLWISQEYKFFLKYSSYVPDGFLFYSAFNDYFQNQSDFNNCNFTQRLENFDGDMNHLAKKLISVYESNDVNKKIYF
ncbi:unnamed protein product [Brachionus calyciflorus]|uniref:Transmembrane protein n=1 Tax=Brachionus calyciflorus TaxID=104777 RepID=A0A814N8M4_9BILA|nr:unnamed protein product [Brachionus calyciflorus]